MIVENKYESLDLWLTAVEEQDYQMYRFEDETSIRYEAFSSEARLAGWLVQHAATRWCSA